MELTRASVLDAADQLLTKLANDEEMILNQLHYSPSQLAALKQSISVTTHLMMMLSANRAGYNYWKEDFGNADVPDVAALMITISQNPIIRDILERSMVGVPYVTESDYVQLINAIRECYMLRFGKTIQSQAVPGWSREKGMFATKAEKDHTRNQRQQADLRQSTGELIFDVF
ncbi:hypothetical protein [Limosilactobacillus mucosae]|uniref:Uncharacterized protein n=1 Tax=Limosilactobacillus mucosae TaxID=97478 RepID=A0AAJ1HSN8_LIMMU|nr:hypothetical protein [Limosilactobacillus mucosae]MDC2828950.1 hypothetical protein [Limosilactobacillus mucosae]